MAYVEVHYGQWDDDGGTAHQIKLLQEGGSGPSVRIALLAPTPCTIKRRGGKNIQLKNHIYGSELKFNFLVHDDDIVAFDLIFESDYKEWKIEHYYNSVLDWVGWLLPDNHSRGWIKKGDYYPISLSATDGLAKLKEIEFVNFSTGAQYTDRVSIMVTLKRALEHVGHELDFRIQLGTNCTNDSLMTSTELALHKVTVDNSRYTKNKDGRQVNEDCYTLIEKTLKDFNCYLIQEDGLYWIVNPQEKNSFYFSMQWSTITTVDSRTAHDLAISLDNYKYNGYGEKQRIRPFEVVEATFRDRNVQDSLLSNGDFAANNTNEWTAGADIHQFLTIATSDNYELKVTVNPLVSGNPTTVPNFYSDAQVITVRGDSDQIQVNFKLRCTAITMDGGFSGSSDQERTTVTCRLRKGSPTGTILSSGLPITLGASDSTYTEYILLFNLSEDDNYYIEFLIAKHTDLIWDDYDYIECRFDDISITTLYTDGPDITFDAFYKITNTDSDYIGKFEHEMFFGDSVQDNDIGSFQIGGTRTETWDRFGKSEDVSIQILSAQNIIENFGQYKTYLRFQILDPSHNIKAYTLLNEVRGVEYNRDYQILSHTIIYAKSKKKHIKAEVAEVLNDAVGTSVTTQLLTTIDGQGSSASTVINYSPSSGGVTDHGNLTGLGDDDHPQYDKVITFVEGLTRTGNNVSITGDFSNHILLQSENGKFFRALVYDQAVATFTKWSKIVVSDDDILLSHFVKDAAVGGITFEDTKGRIIFYDTIQSKGSAIEIDINDIIFKRYSGGYAFNGAKYDEDYSANWGTIDSNNLYIPHLGWIMSKKKELNEWYVKKSGSDTAGSGDGSQGTPYLTITKAITAASADDVIYVGAGTFTEDLAISKTLVMIGVGRDATITSLTVIIGTITFTNNADLTWHKIRASANLVESTSTSHMVVNDCNFVSNTSASSITDYTVRNSLQSASSGVFDVTGALRVEGSIVGLPSGSDISGLLVYQSQFNCDDLQNAANGDWFFYSSYCEGLLGNTGTSFFSFNTKFAANAIRGIFASPVDTYTIRRELTQAEMQALNTTPINLIAISATSLGEVVSIVAVNEFNTSAFGTATKLSFKYQTSGTLIGETTTSFVQAAAYRAEKVALPASSFVIVAGEDIMVEADADATGGNAATKVHCIVTIRNLATT